MQCPKMSKRTSDAKCRDLTHPETFEVQFTDRKSKAKIDTKTNTRIGWSDLVLPWVSTIVSFHAKTSERPIQSQRHIQTYKLFLVDGNIVIKSWKKVILFCELSRRKSISATQYLFKLRRCPKRRAHCALSSSQNWKSWQQLIAANQIWAKFLLIVPFWNITTVNVVATNQISHRQNCVQKRSFSLRVICTLTKLSFDHRWDHH